MTEGARVGYQIRTLRKQTGQTQEQVAHNLFISISYLGQIEQGKANPSVNMVKKIVSYLEAVLDGTWEETDSDD